jgi:hypothetical protein
MCSTLMFQTCTKFRMHYSNGSRVIVKKLKAAENFQSGHIRYYDIFYR